jgi:predicted transposase YbfD/YdcC
MSAAGHNSLTAIAEWVRRCDPQELSGWAARSTRSPAGTGSRTSGRYAMLTAGSTRTVLSAAGYGHLAALARSESAALAPDGVPEREQRRADLAAAADPPPAARRTAVAVDGKCLRGAKRSDGSQVFVLSAVRHVDAVTLAAGEIGAKTNEISQFPPLLEQIADVELTDAVITVDALHAQRAHAIYLVEQRHAHYLITIKDNQPSLAAQLRRLPWRRVPDLHRQTSRGHGRHEIRGVQVVTVDDLLFPHARQVVRIRRRRRQFGTKMDQRGRLRDHGPTCPPGPPRGNRHVGPRTLDHRGAT